MKRASLKYIAALLLFGSNGIIANHIGLTSYEIVLLRTLLGSLLLVAIFFPSKQKPAFHKHKRDMIFIVVSGIAMGASWMFLYEAYIQIGVSISSLLYYCGPVIVMILSPIIFRERLTLFKIAGFLVVLLGLFFVNGQAFDGDGGNTFGLFCGGMSAITYSIMVIANKKSKHIVGMENSVLQLIVSFLTVAVFVGFKSGLALHVQNVDWIWILILGFINTGIGCYFYFSSIGKLSVQTVAICGYLEPLSAVLFSVIFLSEKMLPLQIAGALLIVGGAVLGESLFKKQKIDLKV